MRRDDANRIEITPFIPKFLYQIVPRLSLSSILSRLSPLRINNLRVFSRPYGFDFHTPPPHFAGMGEWQTDQLDHVCSVVGFLMDCMVLLGKEIQSRSPSF